MRTHQVSNSLFVLTEQPNSHTGLPKPNLKRSFTLEFFVHTGPTATRWLAGGGCRLPRGRGEGDTSVAAQSSTGQNSTRAESSRSPVASASGPGPDRPGGSSGSVTTAADGRQPPARSARLARGVPGGTGRPVKGGAGLRPELPRGPAPRRLAGLPAASRAAAKAESRLPPPSSTSPARRGKQGRDSRPAAYREPAAPVAAGPKQASPRRAGSGRAGAVR